MNFKQWITDLFKDERGLTSVKPLIAFIGTLFLCGTMCVPNFNPSSELINAVMIITIVGMGGDTIDKFSLKNKPTDI